MKISEFELIRRMTAQVPRVLSEKGRMRDDAALVKVAKGHLLFTTDILVEGVDFIRKQTTPEQIGQKALGVNLSDIAAMGGQPLYFTTALGIPPRMEPAWFVRFYRGMMKWAAEFHVICAGGDISSAGELLISITVLGTCTKSGAVMRGGAKPGDWIGVTGRLGGSILGHHLSFTPRIREGCFLNHHGVHAMIDISDGFLQDLGHILEQSGVGARLEASMIPVSREAVRKARGDRARALEYALSDGEDFELLFTMNPKKAAGLTRAWKRKFSKVPLTWVGVLTDEKNKLIWSLRGKPCEAPRFQKTGFLHSL